MADIKEFENRAWINSDIVCGHNMLLVALCAHLPIQVLLWWWCQVMLHRGQQGTVAIVGGSDGFNVLFDLINIIW